MLLFLMRHGIAVDREECPKGDEFRELTPKGRDRVGEIAGMLKKLGVDPTHYVASPRLRAQETADIVREVISGKKGPKVQTLTALDFDGTWEGFVDQVREVTRGDPRASVMAAGHEPNIGQFLTAALIHSQQGFHVKKGGVAGLSWPETIATEGAEMRFYLTYSMVKKL